jgi:DNA-binding response OmpR family regulator
MWAGNLDSQRGSLLDDRAAQRSGLAEPERIVVMENGSKCVLVVEDEPGLRRLIAATLADAGLDCVVAKDGEEGLRRASGADVGAAVVDLGLPGMTGAELAWRLTRAVPDAHVVAMSGQLELWDVDDLKDLGFIKVLAKPFDVDELVATLVEVLSAPGDVARNGA